eukprot:TRINITY_DN3016_c0_g1_i1.p1 TRINITY_DN3016_c0_g1~~TRINITY_DN3016_c0_g1_i1.p1  ORF type:complete len:1656 (+),score=453.23 TRINITY_DN3016_c0_g1_i1:57-4970(+)
MAGAASPVEEARALLDGLLSHLPQLTVGGAAREQPRLKTDSKDVVAREAQLRELSKGDSAPVACQDPTPGSSELWLRFRRLNASQIGGDTVMDGGAAAAAEPPSDLRGRQKRAQKMYQQLYETVRESQVGEDVQLVVGVGQLMWQEPSVGSIDSFLVHFRVDVRMTEDGDIVIERAMSQLDPQIPLADVVTELAQLGPLISRKLPVPVPPPGDRDAWRPCLKYCADRLTHDAECVDGPPPPGTTPSSTPRIYNTFCVMRTHEGGRVLDSETRALRRSLHSLPADQFPPALGRLVGVNGLPPIRRPPPTTAAAGWVSLLRRPQKADDTHTQHPFFPLSSNRQQADILQHLEEYDTAVLVGPPGTGKTQTIANVICDRLARGQKVLVTSKSEVATAVVLDKLPEEVRKLTVCLGAGAESAQKKSVNELFGAVVKHVMGVVQKEKESNLLAERDDALARVKAQRDRIAGLRQREAEWAKLYITTDGLGDRGEQEGSVESCLHRDHITVLAKFSPAAISTLSTWQVVIDSARNVEPSSFTDGSGVPSYLPEHDFEELNPMMKPPADEKIQALSRLRKEAQLALSWYGDEEVPRVGGLRQLQQDDLDSVSKAMQKRAGLCKQLEGHPLRHLRNHDAGLRLQKVMKALSAEISTIASTCQEPMLWLGAAICKSARREVCDFVDCADALLKVMESGDGRRAVGHTGRLCVYLPQTILHQLHLGNGCDPFVDKFAAEARRLAGVPSTSWWPFPPTAPSDPWLQVQFNLVRIGDADGPPDTEDTRAWGQVCETLELHRIAASLRKAWQALVDAFGAEMLPPPPRDVGLSAAAANQWLQATVERLAKDIEPLRAGARAVTVAQTPVRLDELVATAFRNDPAATECVMTAVKNVSKGLIAEVEKSLDAALEVHESNNDARFPRREYELMERLQADATAACAGGPADPRKQLPLRRFSVALRELLTTGGDELVQKVAGLRREVVHLEDSAAKASELRALLRELQQVHGFPRGWVRAIQQCADAPRPATAPLRDTHMANVVQYEQHRVLPLWAAAAARKAFRVLSEKRDDAVNAFAGIAEEERRLRKQIEVAVVKAAHYSMKREIDSAALAAMRSVLSSIGQTKPGLDGYVRLESGVKMSDMMRSCVDCVRCWIMPLWRIAQCLPPDVGSFDLVIVDEATQCDAGALAAVLRGKQVLVVGDPKQVSPIAVGVRTERKHDLAVALRTVAGLPRAVAENVVPGRSIFDHAAACLAVSTVELRQHFRSVPDNIAFSNRHYYGGSLRPCRLPVQRRRLVPPLIDVEVLGGKKVGKVNHAEAGAIAFHLAKAIRPGGDLYDCDPPVTIGVIAMIGTQQAKAIWKRLCQTLTFAERYRHRVTCGEPQNFQGDEFNVVYLSMMASPGGVAACPKQTDSMYHQRANVAMSRAKDRIVLVRSLSDGDVKDEGDVKKIMLDHFDPAGSAVSTPAASGTAADRDPILRSVCEELRGAGYQVNTGMDVAGAAVVVEGADGTRVAVCVDGSEDGRFTVRHWQDLRREEVVLSAVDDGGAWKFWRCWRSEWEANRRPTLRRLQSFLRDHGIGPEPTKATLERVRCEKYDARAVKTILDDDDDDDEEEEEEDVVVRKRPSDASKAGDRKRQRTATKSPRLSGRRR